MKWVDLKGLVAKSKCPKGDGWGGRELIREGSLFKKIYFQSRGGSRGGVEGVVLEARGRISPSTPLALKVTTIVYNPPFQKFLEPPLQRGAY